MGAAKSKEGGGGGAGGDGKGNGKPAHPLLDNAEHAAVVSAFRGVSKGAAEIGSPALCAWLGLPEELASAVGGLLGAAKASGAVSEKAFVDAVALLFRGTTTDARRRMFLASEAAGVEKAVALAFHAGGGTGDVAGGPLRAGLEAFTRDAQAESGFGTFNLWCTAALPALHEPVVELIAAKVLGVAAVEGPRAGRVPAAVAKTVREQSEVLDVGAVFALSCLDSRCQGGWARLFSSSVDGMSFDSLIKGLIGYPGPTLLAIKDTEGNAFGALVSEEWQESGVFYGKPNSMLFALAPAFAVRRCRSDGSAPGTGNFQYLKARGRSGNKGIGLGGDEHGLRLWLDRNFEECRAADFDLTYDAGALRPGAKAFQPLVIEAWGLGGEGAAQAQAAEQADVERMKANRRKVDRKKFADSAFDREFLLGKTFAHQEQAKEREGR